MPSGPLWGEKLCGTVDQSCRRATQGDNQSTEMHVMRDMLMRKADQAEVDHYWEALLAGGSEGQCGWLKDRWGLFWQVVPRRLPELLSDPEPGRAQRAMEAMLQMKRIVIADLEHAADRQ